MQTIKIIQRLANEEIVADDNKIKLSFDIINKHSMEFHDCCLKVTLDEQVLRHDLPTLDDKLSDIEVEFEKLTTLKRELNASCQIFQGDRILGAIDHKITIN